MDKNNPHIALYLDNTWVTDTHTLTQMLRQCVDVSSILTKEFLEASSNGILSVWLRQQDQFALADKIERIAVSDDDKTYLDELKRILLNITASDTRRPPLSDYVVLKEVMYRRSNEKWEKLDNNTGFIILNPDYQGECDMKFVFRPKKPVKAVYPLSLKVATYTEKGKKTITEKGYISEDIHLSLGGKTEKETIEMFFNNVLHTGELPSEANYQITLSDDCGYTLLDCKILRQEKNALSFEIDGVKFKMIRVEDHPAGVFYIGETQVTQELWHSIAKNVSDLKDVKSHFKGKKRPMDSVSWGDCDKFIKELNNQFQESLPEGYIFALPTESQWEYAARGGNKNRGNSYSGCNDQTELKQYAWYYINSENKTHDVKTRRPNELDLYDMSGNVWEWCEDFFSGTIFSRVLRGGSWNSNAANCRVSCRSYHSFFHPFNDVGFRLVLAQQ